MKILYFDVAAAVILLIMLASLFFRKMVSGRASGCLILLLVSILLASLFDILAESYGVWMPIDAVGREARMMLYNGYFLFRILNLLLYQLYICAVTDTWHVLKKNKGLQCVVLIPYLVNCAVVFINAFTHKVYYLDDNLVYHRGPFIYAFHVIVAIYFIVGTAYLIYYKRLLSMDKFIVLLLLYPLNLVAILIQLFFPEYLVEMFMTTITLLLITIVVQRPEETINPVLGVRSSVAYVADMKKAFYIRKPLRVLFVKLVNYHSLASLLGYESCNQRMKQIVSLITNYCRQERLLADLYYLGVGLFVMTTEKDEPVKMQSIAEKLSNALTKDVQFDNLEVELSPCICMLRCPRDIDSYEGLLSFGETFYTYLPADGRINNISEMEDRRMLQLRNDMDGILRKAIVDNGFEMYYQPIYSTKEKRFLSAEALIRLQDERYGFIPPSLFIPAAERNGTIIQIGDFVFEEVCRFLARCREENIPIKYIELNLSMVQCMQQDLKKKVLYYLEKYDLQPEQINLEITETAANTSQDIVEKNILTLAEKNINFSLDDFGTGYSNISRIVSLPFRIVKLDKSLVDKMNEPGMSSFFKRMIQMLKEVGMEIVVEGVETREGVQWFTELECDYVQGFYFSKPLPEQAFVDFILEYK